MSQPRHLDPIHSTHHCTGCPRDFAPTSATGGGRYRTIDDSRDNHKRRLRIELVAAILVALFGFTLVDTARAELGVNVTRVGFPTLSGNNAVRNGAWFAIVVDVSLINQASFDGSLRIGQYDVDGDECFDRVEVHLRAETGGSQRVYLYALANVLRSRRMIDVELFDAENEAVEMLSQGESTFHARPSETSGGSANHFTEMQEDDILILSLSDGAIGRVRDLVETSQRGIYARRLNVAHMSPIDLPELWIGLESVDYIVWDDPRLERLTDQQIQAVLDWVRQGGTLLMAASQTAGSLELTESLNAALPVDLGDVSVVDNLPDLREELLGAESSDKESARQSRISQAAEEGWWRMPFPAPITVVQCTLRDGANTIPRSAKCERNILSRRAYGRGQVIFSGVTLADLFSGPGRAVDFFQTVFALPIIANPEDPRPSPTSLFPHVTGAVAFSAWGSLYLGAAFLFSAAYLLIATFGTWWFLDRKGWTHYSWSLFAVVALVASFLSILAVNTVHGFGETLHQISIVDVDSANGHGYATCFFGLKTGMDREVDLWLPSDSASAEEPVKTGCFLRPLPPASNLTDQPLSYADPQPYRLLPGSAVLDDVRIRSTLKRFEGRWDGPLRGAVTGDITIKGEEIVEASYIVNDFGVDLQDCYLIQTQQALSRSPGFRDRRIYAFPIGRLPADGARVDLRSRCYQLEGNEKLTQFLIRNTLAKAQEKWSKEISSFLTGTATGQERNALLLATTVGEFDAMHNAGMTQIIMGAQSWSRDRLRSLDMRAQMELDHVLLIGFARDPGPARLFRRTGDSPYRLIEPDLEHSWSMYRFKIPVQRTVAQPVDELDELLEEEFGD